MLRLTLPQHWGWYLAGLALALVGTLAAGCSGAAKALEVRLGEDVRRPSRAAFIFFVDGLDLQRLHELAAEGHLPAIKRTFIDGGVGVRHAIAGMPSITYPNSSSIITGCFPGHHQILGNFWFDHRTLECRDYRSLATYRTVNDHLARATLYDMLGDEFSVSIQLHTRKGATKVLENTSVLAWAWAIGQYSQVDRYVGEELENVARLADHIKRWPTVIMTYYPGVDENGHRFGPGSPEYLVALKTIDDVVARVTASLAEAGLGQDTFYALVSDHGMPPVTRGQDMAFLDWLAAHKGLTIRQQSLGEDDYRGRSKALKGYNAVAIVDAGRVAMVHLNLDDDWSVRPSGEKLHALATAAPAIHELPAVGLVAMRAGQNAARAWSRSGSLLIERRTEGSRRLYRLAAYEGDPLGYRGVATAAAWLDGSWHESREWLAATAGSPSPDFVPQVVEMFDSPRAGDLVVFAAEGCALYMGEAAGHGSQLARDMHTCMFFSGPGLPAGATIDHARLVDFTPTLLGLLGQAERIEKYSPMDGVDLSAQIRQAHE